MIHGVLILKFRQFIFPSGLFDLFQSVTRIINKAAHITSSGKDLKVRSGKVEAAADHLYINCAPSFDVCTVVYTCFEAEPVATALTLAIRKADICYPHESPGDKLLFRNIHML